MVALAYKSSRFFCSGPAAMVAPTRPLMRLMHGFNTVPSNTAYYELVMDDNDTDAVLGPKRVESSRMEAAMRRIAQKLFLHDEAQRALLEHEINQDEKQFVEEKRLQYLRDFSDTRDIAPRPLPTSQTRLAKELRATLQKNSPTLVQDVAQILWQHPICRRSTFQMVTRELLQLGHGRAAQHVMESLLMAIKKRPTTPQPQYPISSLPGDESDGAISANWSAILNTNRSTEPSTEPSTSSSGDITTSPSPFDQPLGNSSYALCLELAMANSDHSWFLELSHVARNPPRGALQQKFSLVPGDAAVELLLAEGYMKFRHPHLLNKVLNRNRGSANYVKLLAVSMEMACRFSDEQRARSTFDEFMSYFDPSSEDTVRFLLLARKHESTKYSAARLVPKLTPGKQKLYKRKEPIWQYVHPYANPTRH